MILRKIALAVAVSSSLLSGCGGGNDAASIIIPATSSSYVVVAWNDLGMHCLNPSYDTAVILPPYNTVWAQIVQRGNLPQIVTSTLTAEYHIVNNTYSYGKRNYGQFWDNMAKIFGASLEQNQGLNLVDQDIHNSLAGKFVSKGDHFQVDGIPITPVNDSGAWNPYQVMEVVIKDASGNRVAGTRATVPTSDEIYCSRCPPLVPFLTSSQNMTQNIAQPFKQWRLFFAQVVMEVRPWE